MNPLRSLLHGQVILLTLLCLGLVGCSKSDEPQPDETTKLLRIYGDDFNEAFTRSTHNDIKSYMRHDGEIAIQADYTHLKNGTILISTKITQDGRETACNDTIYFSRGLVESCNGSQAGIYYRIYFSYKNSRLSSIEWTQWKLTDESERRGRPWTRTNTLSWDKNGNLTSYHDAAGNSQANALTHVYTYTGMYSKEPFQIPFTILPQYIPLQLDGMFGDLPQNLIDTESITGTSDNLDIIYDYTVRSGQIIGFTQNITTLSTRISLNRFIEWDD